MSVPLTKPFQSPLQMRQKRGQNRRTGSTRKSDIAHFSNMCIYNDTALAALAPDPKFIQAGRRPCLGQRNPARPVSRAARTSGTYSYMLIVCSDRSIESSTLFLQSNQMGIIPLSHPLHSNKRQSMQKWNSALSMGSGSKYSTPSLLPKGRGKGPTCCRPLAGIPPKTGRGLRGGDASQTSARSVSRPD